MSTLFHVHDWAVRNGASRDAIYELKKVPARLGMHDDDLGIIPACLRHFEAIVAPSGYGVVSRSHDLETARRRGNARVRSLIQQFHASVAPSAAPTGTARGLWDPLIDYVEDCEGFPEKGAPWTKGASRSLFMLRARATCGPAALTQAEIDRIGAALDGAKRKSLRKAVARINKLIEAAPSHPAIVPMLPTSPLHPPAPADRAMRIVWSTLPAAFRASVDALLERATETPESQAQEARRRIAAGEDRAAVLAEFETQRTREMKNRAAAHAGYRNAVAWLLRAEIERGLDPAALSDVHSIFTIATMEQAIGDQVARSRASLRLKAPEKSQAIQNRMTALHTLARYGLRDTALVEDIKLLVAANRKMMKKPGQDQMTEEARLFCKQLIQAPHVATRLVNAPEQIAAAAEALIAEAVKAKSEEDELSALRLYAAAVLFAIQMSRPVRSANLIRARVSAVAGALYRLVWLKKARHAEFVFPPGEVKNDIVIKVSVYEGDAAILWRWVTDLRPRYMELRGLSESAYLIPGAALPRLLKDGVMLPRGCVAASTLAEIWDEGRKRIGLELTPHMARHAVATLILALEPGNFAKAAAVLGDTEETVRKHYGHEDGARASAEVRKALLANHPDLFRTMKKRSTQS
jgi:integrase